MADWSYSGGGIPMQSGPSGGGPPAEQTFKGAPNTGNANSTWGNDNREPSAPGGGGTPSNPGASWGSFGVKGNWDNAFFVAHNRMPNVQDEVDYWDSQEFAFKQGRAPDPNEWYKRYYSGSFSGDGPWTPLVGADGYQVQVRGRDQWLPFAGGSPRTQEFFDMLIQNDRAPEQFREGFSQWAEGLKSRGDTPDWLRQDLEQADQIKQVNDGTGLPGIGDEQPTLPAEPINYAGAPPVTDMLDYYAPDPTQVGPTIMQNGAQPTEQNFTPYPFAEQPAPTGGPNLTPWHQQGVVGDIYGRFAGEPVAPGTNYQLNSPDIPSAGPPARILGKGINWAANQALDVAADQLWGN